MTADLQRMRFERRGPVAVATFDHAADRNAFSMQVREELRQVVGLVRAEPEISSLVLTGANGHFCSGGDLRNIANANLDGGGWRQRMRSLHHWLRDLLLLDKPVIAAVDGAAAGAGFSLALAADFVLATPRARFAMSFIKVGAVPDCGALYTLPRVVGAQRARELMLSGRDIDAQEALQLGIALELHEPDRLLPRAIALGESFAGASPMAVSLIKRALADVPALEAAFDAEANGQALAFGTPEHKEAVQRFLHKQPPAFQWPAAQA